MKRGIMPEPQASCPHCKQAYPQNSDGSYDPEQHHNTCKKNPVNIIALIKSGLASIRHDCDLLDSYIKGLQP